MRNGAFLGRHFRGFTAKDRYVIMKVLVPSSSGLGRLVLIQKIAGSTPAGITIENENNPLGLFLFSMCKIIQAGVNPFRGAVVVGGE